MTQWLHVLDILICNCIKLTCFVSVNYTCIEDPNVKCSVWDPDLFATETTATTSSPLNTSSPLSTSPSQCDKCFWFQSSMWRTFSNARSHCRNQFWNMYEGDRPKLLEPRDEAFYNFTKGALETFYEPFRIEQKIGKLKCVWWKIHAIVFGITVF